MLPMEAISHGLKNPRLVPEYVLGELFPDRFSHLGRSWKIEDGTVTWRDQWWGNNSPAEISAIDFHTYQHLKLLLSGKGYERALEVGSGYGRVTAWLTEFADEVVGLEPNSEMARMAERHYADQITIKQGKAQDMEFPDDSFDLILSWTVLHHIPPEHIADVCAEISRVAEPGCTLVINEHTRGPAESPTVWARSKVEYERVLEGFLLNEEHDREVPGVAKENSHQVLKFVYE